MRKIALVLMFTLIAACDKGSIVTEQVVPPTKTGENPSDTTPIADHSVAEGASCTADVQCVADLKCADLVCKKPVSAPSDPCTAANTFSVNGVAQDIHSATVQNEEGYTEIDVFSVPPGMTQLDDNHSYALFFEVCLPRVATFSLWAPELNAVPDEWGIGDEPEQCVGHPDLVDVQVKHGVNGRGIYGKGSLILSNVDQKCWAGSFDVELPSGDKIKGTFVIPPGSEELTSPTRDEPLFSETESHANREVKSLSESEKQAFCEELEEDTRVLIQRDCYTWTSDCQSCLEHVTQADIVEAQCKEELDLLTSRLQCSVTVGELKKCYDAMSDYTSRLLPDLSCHEPDVDGTSLDFPELEACQIASEKCPEPEEEEE